MIKKYLFSSACGVAEAVSLIFYDNIGDKEELKLLREGLDSLPKEKQDESNKKLQLLKNTLDEIIDEFEEEI